MRLLVDRFKIPLDLTTVPAIENFVGRQAELDSLWQYFKTQDPLIQSRKVAILHGLGGMGKTQLAVRFVRERKHDFTAILWLNGKDRGTLLQSLSSVLPRLPGQTQANEEGISGDKQLEQRARQVLQWLAEEGNSRWLIIFDNIDQYSPTDGDAGNGYDIGRFFPAADHGCILITSRLPGLTELGESFPIRKLDSTEATQLLLKNSGLSANSAKELEDDPGKSLILYVFDLVVVVLMDLDILALMDRLDGLPLAIIIAAAFMRQTGTSPAQYLRYYKRSWSDLQSQSAPGRQYLQGNMLQTWMISYREIKMRDPNAATLLLLLAQFNNRDIWFELVQGASNSSDIPEWLKSYLSSELVFKAGVRSLIQFSLLETKQHGDSYAMHPVVQDWCFHVASDDMDLSNKLSELAFICVGWSVPSKFEREYVETCRRLIPHANAMRLGQVSTNDSAIWKGFHGLGNLFNHQGRPKEAEEMYLQALTGMEHDFGPENIATFDVLNDLCLLQSQGNFKGAEESLRRALIGYEKALNPDDPTALDIVNNLGVLYRQQGRPKEAEESFQRALISREKALGPDHLSTLDIIRNLGALYQSRGRLKEAEENLQRALKGYEKALGPAHVFTLYVVNTLGRLYRRQGKLRETEECFQRVLAGREIAFGPNHPSTLDTVNNLGLLYQDQSKWKEAEEMYQRALAGYEKVFGPSHQTHASTVRTFDNLANLYRNNGRLEEAEQLYRRALADREKALGPNHPSTIGTVNSLAVLYRQQGKLEEAEGLSQRALAAKEETLGPNHLSTLSTVTSLGTLYRQQGRLQEAENMFRRALAGYKIDLGPSHQTHPSALRTFHNLGKLYYSQGRLKEAEEMYERALEGREHVFGPDHHDTRDTSRRLNRLRISDRDESLEQLEGET